MFQTVKKSLYFHLVAVNDFVMYILGMWVITMRMLMYGATVVVLVVFCLILTVKLSVYLFTFCTAFLR